MKAQYDFSKGKRGAVTTPDPEPAGKTRVTIRLDQDILDHFFEKADATGGKIGYETFVNDALRCHSRGANR